ncbi:MAG: gltX [Candidatus Taylorbacteria bacterium]|nr:gltX [Candidatus Taylorbacteria bacterium]
MAENTQKVVTRFAPSPTGFMHIGGVRTALFAYLWATKTGGTFILRIEDTDKAREVEGSIQQIQDSLKWLGIEWKYGPDKPGPFGSCIQSQRLDTYREAAQKLVDKGLAYPDPFTTEQIEEFRKKAEAEKRPFLFRDYRPETFEKWDGKQPLRFKTPEIKRYKWHDVVRGDLEAGEEALDDFILIKGDGYPTYNFAHIVDDLNMGVTHIFRGDEFISSTPRFLSLYDGLGITPPVFASLPPILRDDRTKKLGKRDGAKDILDYKSEGYLPEAMMNFLALIGWNPGGDKEIFSRDELVQAFVLEKIQKGGGAFNEEKLAWMNKEYISKISDEQFFEHAKPFIPAVLLEGKTPVKLDKIIPLLREKIHVFSEIPALFAPDGELAFALPSSAGAPAYEGKSLVWKGTDPSSIKSNLQKALELISAVAPENFTAENVKAAVWDFAAAIPKESGGKGAVLWPMRYALSGKEKSPDPFVLSEILGKEETLSRLTHALSLL